MPPEQNQSPDNQPNPSELPAETPAQPPAEEQVPAQTAEPAAPAIDSSPVVSSRPPAVPPKSRKKLWMIVTAVVVIVLAAVAAYLLLHKSKPVASNQPAPTTHKSVNKTDTVTPDAAQLAKFVTPTTGEVWDASPTKVSNPGYYDDGTNGANGPDTSTYYRVGTHGQNIIYLRQTLDVGEDLMLYEKAPDGTVRAIIHPAANQTYNADFDKSTIDSLHKNIIADTTTHYDSLSPPAIFTINKTEAVKVGQHGYVSEYLGSLLLDDSSTNDSSVSTSTVKEYGQSKLVKVERKYTDTGLTAINYALNTPIGTRIYLDYQPINQDLSTYNWSNGVKIAKVTDKTGLHSSDIAGIVRGCGTSGTAMSRADKLTDKDFVAAGKTSDGKTVYAFADNNNSIVQKAYNEYKEAYTGDSSVKVLSFSDFLKQHALVAYKDAAGEWLVYTRNEFSPGGGCAKPVVYLYPTHTEGVSVRLEANVTKSDPYYNPVSGWNVVAQPNGQLLSGGHNYGSLFWEGQGSGLYPGITAGTVVKYADALATIKSQLKQQGLNATETNDFVGYWQSKIPHKPYVRLTWFNTAQMNTLAPLRVSPAPDTVIRLFLDMDGYNTPIKLPAQHLSATPRRGFTVVEWGGLSQASLK